MGQDLSISTEQGLGVGFALENAFWDAGQTGSISWIVKRSICS